MLSRCFSGYVASVALWFTMGGRAFQRFANISPGERVVFPAG